MEQWQQSIKESKQKQWKQGITQPLESFLRFEYKGGDAEDIRNKDLQYRDRHIQRSIQMARILRQIKGTRDSSQLGSQPYAGPTEQSKFLKGEPQIEHRKALTASMMLCTYSINVGKFSVSFTRRYREVVKRLDEARSPYVVPFFYWPKSAESDRKSGSKEKDYSLKMYSVRGRHGNREKGHKVELLEGMSMEAALWTLKGWAEMNLVQAKCSMCVLDSHLNNTVMIGTNLVLIDVEKTEICPHLRSQHAECNEWCELNCQRVREYFQGHKSEDKAGIDMQDLGRNQELIEALGLRQNQHNVRPPMIKKSQVQSIDSLEGQFQITNRTPCQIINQQVERSHYEQFKSTVRVICQVLKKKKEGVQIKISGSSEAEIYSGLALAQFLEKKLSQNDGSVVEAYRSFKQLIDDHLLPRNKQSHGIRYRFGQQVQEIVCPPQRVKVVAQVIRRLWRRSRMTSVYLLEEGEGDCGVQTSQAEGKVWVRRLKNAAEGTQQVQLTIQAISESQYTVLAWLENLVCLAWDLEEAGCRVSGQGLQFLRSLGAGDGWDELSRCGEFGFRLTGLRFIELISDYQRLKAHEQHLRLIGYSCETLLTDKQLVEDLRQQIESKLESTASERFMKHYAEVLDFLEQHYRVKLTERDSSIQQLRRP